MNIGGMHLKLVFLVDHQFYVAPYEFTQMENSFNMHYKKFKPSKGLLPRSPLEGW